MKNDLFHAVDSKKLSFENWKSPWIELIIFQSVLFMWFKYVSSIGVCRLTHKALARTFLSCRTLSGQLYTFSTIFVPPSETTNSYTTMPNFFTLYFKLFILLPKLSHLGHFLQRFLSYPKLSHFTPFCTSLKMSQLFATLLSGIEPGTFGWKAQVLTTRQTGI